MTLYEIDQRIMECWDPETGEILDEQRLDELQMARDTKIENIALWIKNLKSDKEALKAEKESFAQRQKATENRIESLTRYLETALNGEKFKSPKVAITYRKSEQVVIADGTKLIKQYLRYKDPEPDKTAIKEAIKAGKKIKGVTIEERMNMQIK